MGTTHVLVTAESTSGGRQVFTVAKATSSGLDSTFGTGGIARANFAGQGLDRADLALLPGGKILLAGSVRPTVTSTDVRHRGSPG